MSTEELPQPGFIAKYKVEIYHLKAALDVAFGTNVKSNPDAPEDRVVFALGVATRDLCEEVIWFLNAGFGFAAVRTARTLYECVVFSFYINKHPGTWEAYLQTMYGQWAKVLQNVPGADRTLPEMHRAISEKVPKYARGKTVSLNWNDDRTIHKMAKAVGISDLFHSLAFNYTSGFVHPSAMFLLRCFRQSSPDGPLLIGVNRPDMEGELALQITHDMVINAVRLRMKYSDSAALRGSLKVCEEDFLRIWGYQPQLTQSI